MDGVEVGGLLGGCHGGECIVGIEGVIKVVRRVCTSRSVEMSQ